jgi:hypothetical protein
MQRTAMWTKQRAGFRRCNVPGIGSATRVPRTAPFEDAGGDDKTKREDRFACVRRSELIARAAAGLTQKTKKAAWFPRRPFLSYGGSTFTGDLRTSAPGAYLPAVS